VHVVSENTISQGICIQQYVCFIVSYMDSQENKMDMYNIIMDILVFCLFVSFITLYSAGNHIVQCMNGICMTCYHHHYNIQRYLKKLCNIYYQHLSI